MLHNKNIYVLNDNFTLCIAWMCICPVVSETHLSKVAFYRFGVGWDVVSKYKKKSECFLPGWNDGKENQPQPSMQKQLRLLWSNFYGIEIIFLWEACVLRWPQEILVSWAEVIRLFLCISRQYLNYRFAIWTGYVGMLIYSETWLKLKFVRSFVFG